jgi:hypothetical protein
MLSPQAKHLAFLVGGAEILRSVQDDDLVAPPSS